MSEPNPFINKAPSTKSAQHNANLVYENNPFFVATKGVELLFNKAKSIGILLAVLAGLGFLGSLPGSFAPTFNTGDNYTPPKTQTTRTNATQDTPAPSPSLVTPATDTSAQNKRDEFVNGLKKVPLAVWVIGSLIILTIVLVAMFIGFVLQGITDYTAAKLARGKEVTLSEAFSGVFKNFWGYAWVQVIAGVKTFLWSLLFIVPGFIMSYRYSLAGVSFFEKKQKGNKAIEHSLALTKGAWLTTFASHSLLPMLALGAITQLLLPGTRAILYRQLEPLTAKNQPKPAAHIVAWLTLLLPIILWVMLVLLVVGIALVIMAVSS